jgi:hypothetical protein
MALSRVKVWIPGDVLTASDLNGEFNNVLNNPINLVSPTTGPINFNLQAHTGLLPSVISGTSGVAGSLLVLSTAATPAPIWAGSAMQGSRPRGLRGVLSSQSGTFTADQYLMQTSNGSQSWVVTATSSFSASVGTAGPAAGGRDIAAAFGSTYVHWYAISTGVGSTAPAAIVSTATPPTGPVLPTGYTGWTYLGGSIYTSASTTVAQDHRFVGPRAYYDSAQAEVTNGNTTAETAVPLGNGAPGNSLETIHSVQTLLQPGNGQTLTLRTVSGSNYHVTSTTASAFNTLAHFQITLPYLSTQFFYLLSSVNVSANDSVQIKLQGYTMPNGDA